jgi:hypothetical protein
MGSPLSLIGPAMSLAGGGKGGGGGGGGGGGVTPQEAALAQYTMQQEELQRAATFANTGTSHSTMNTWASGGPRIAEAMQLAGLSDKNQSVLGNLAQQQAQTEGAAAGKLASSQGGGGTSGTGQGTDSTTTDVTDISTG